MSVVDFQQKQILVLVTKDGQKLSFKNDNVVVRNANGDIIHQSTCYRLFAVFVIGHLSITTGLIQRAKKFGFALVFMTAGFRPYQLISAESEGNVLLRKKQYAYSGLDIARHIVQNKMENQRRLLTEQRDKSPALKESIRLLDGYIAAVPGTDSLQSLMGCEGNASRTYFRELFCDMAWRRRAPRAKIDMVNALLDIGYTILFCYVDAVTALFGFDRYCGFLHQQFYLRKSLICDLVEPFRVIIDRQVRKSIHLGQFREKDFKIYDGRWTLEYKVSGRYSELFFRAINEHKEEIFLYIRDFYRAFMKERELPRWDGG